MVLNAGMMSSNTPEWETPQDLFDKLNDEFHFTIDVCAQPHNAKCERYITPEADGLQVGWDNEVVWMNPPYGRGIGKWVEKISKHKGVALLPARTDTRWFHDYIYEKAEIRFVKGRIQFLNGKKLNNAPFPSMIVIFKGGKS
jgi:site-specific DNA-methyltransferase (adenine-specific)